MEFHEWNPYQLQQAVGHHSHGCCSIEYVWLPDLFFTRVIRPNLFQSAL